jgi:hypothetical protein
MGLTTNDEDDGDDDGSLLSRVPVPPLSNEGIMVKTISTMMHQRKIRMEMMMMIEVMTLFVTYRSCGH